MFMFIPIAHHRMEDYKDISKLEELTIKYQKRAESSRDWVHHLQVVVYSLLSGTTLWTLCIC